MRLGTAFPTRLSVDADFDHLADEMTVAPAEGRGSTVRYDAR